MVYWGAEAKIDLIFIILYFISLVANVPNVFTHGFARSDGYIPLLIVSLLKIVGNILLVLVETGSSTSVEVITWGLILSQLGFYPLIIASLGFIVKWAKAWEPFDPKLTRIPVYRILRILNLVILAAFICGIIAGVWIGNPSSGNVNTGYKLRRAADILFLISVLFVLSFSIFLYSTTSSSGARRDLVLLQVLIVTPIMLLRIIYATVQACLNSPTNPNHNTWVYFGLLMIPDFISVALYTIFGYMIKPVPKTEMIPLEAGYGQKEGVAPIGPDSGGYEQQPQQQAYQAQDAYQQPAQANRRGRRQRRIRGPIHMLIDAIRGDD